MNINVSKSYFTQYSKHLALVVKSKTRQYFITKRGSFSYYKTRRILSQKAAAILSPSEPFLLQNTAGFTKCAVFVLKRAVDKMKETAHDGSDLRLLKDFAEVKILTFPVLCI